jgi:hypothetical protein
MYETYSELSLRALLQLKKMREEALELYDYCLAEGNPGPMINFIEEQIALDPPPLLLLYEIADDIQQRFMSLRENQFDVRHQVVQIFNDLYDMDVAVFFTEEKLEALTPQEAIDLLETNGAEIADDEKALLQRLINQSRDTAAQLGEDIRLTESVQEMVMDWALALASTVARDYSHSLTLEPPTTILH